MQRLRILDQLMFKLEEGGVTRMYMCGGVILDPTDSPYPLDSELLADHLAACMEEVPLMRQRLVQDPLKLGDLRLVEDPDFYARNHVTISTLAGPGGYDELTEALGRFSGTPLDPTRPLWHLEVIDGLAKGRMAVAMHIHHAIMDGSGAKLILGAMRSPEPTPCRKPRGTAWPADTLPSRTRLLGGALMENMQRLYIGTPRFLLANARPIRRSLSQQIRRRTARPGARAEAPERKPLKAHKTSLNTAPISEERVLSYLELPIRDVNALRRTLDCSINDLAMLLCSCALQHYFESTGERIDFDLVAGMPVDIREKGDTTAGNVIAFSRVNLHNSIDNIKERLQAIAAETAEVKRKARPVKAAGEDAPEVDYRSLGALVSPVTLDVVIYAISRLNLMDKATVINVAMSNVPGSQTPVYIAGARLLSQIPMGPCCDGLALNITVTSDDRNLVFGFHGCARTIRDKELLPEGARQAFKSLMKASRRRRATAGTRSRAKKG